MTKEEEWAVIEMELLATMAELRSLKALCLAMLLDNLPPKNAYDSTKRTEARDTQSA